MNQDVIFTPLRFRNLEVKNRIFRSSISGRFDNEDGSLTQTRINWPNWSSIAIKLFMPILYLCSGLYFLPFAVWDFSFGVILPIAYYKLTMSDLHREPLRGFRRNATRPGSRIGGSPAFA